MICGTFWKRKRRTLLLSPQTSGRSHGSLRPRTFGGLPANLRAPRNNGSTVPLSCRRCRSRLLFKIHLLTIHCVSQSMKIVRPVAGRSAFSLSTSRFTVDPSPCKPAFPLTTWCTRWLSFDVISQCSPPSSFWRLRRWDIGSAAGPCHQSTLLPAPRAQSAART